MLTNNSSITILLYSHENFLTKNKAPSLVTLCYFGITSSTPLNSFVLFTTSVFLIDYPPHRLEFKLSPTCSCIQKIFLSVYNRIDQLRLIRNTLSLMSLTTHKIIPRNKYGAYTSSSCYGPSHSMCICY